LTRRRLLAVASAGVAVTALALGALVGCGGGGTDLVVYSGRSEPLMKPFLEEFAEREDIDVRVRFADTGDLVGTLLEEGQETRADVFIGQDAAALEKLRRQDLLQPYSGISKTPARYRAADNSWSGLSGRARVLIVGEGARHPDSVFDLTNPRWRGDIAAPVATNVSFRDWVSAIRIKRGDAFTRDYLEGLERNDLEVLASHGEVRKAVGDGEFDIGLVNHYYVELERREGSQVEAVYTDQGPNEFGVVFNVASAGITRAADHTEEARRLLDFLLEPEVQERFARENFEYPLLPGLRAAPGVRPLADVRITDVSLSELGEEADRTDRLLDEVGLGE
jgi:iron(III) transport system substrate-binding protein